MKMKIKHFGLMCFLILIGITLVGCNNYEIGKNPPNKDFEFITGYSCDYVNCNIETIGNIFNRTYTFNVFLSFSNIGKYEMTVYSSKFKINLYDSYTSDNKKFYGSIIIDTYFEGGYSTYIVPAKSTREIKFITEGLTTADYELMKSKKILFSYDGTIMKTIITIN